MNILLPWIDIEDTVYAYKSSITTDYYVRCKYYPGVKYGGMMGQCFKFNNDMWSIRAFNTQLCLILIEDHSFSDLDAAKKFVDSRLVDVGWKILDDNDKLMVLM